MLRRSTQVFAITVALIGGVAARAWIPVPLAVAYALGCGGVAGVVLAWRTSKWRTVGWCAVAIAIGMWRMEAAYREPGKADPSFFIGKDTVVSGIVARDPDVRLKTVRLVVQAEEVKSGGREGHAVRGKTLVVTSAVLPFEVGDHVVFHCDLARPQSFDDFDYPRYLAKEGIFSVCEFPELISREQGVHGAWWAIARVKRDFIASLGRVVPEPESAFIAGILTGVRGRIPESILEDFRRSGISHLLAISGYNIVIIMEGAMVVLTLCIRRHAAFPVLVALITAFTILVGGDASVVRAAIMGLVLQACYVSDRWYRPARILVMTAAGMLLINPRLLRDDLGFDLSFLATWGIVVLSPQVAAHMRWVTTRWHLREAMSMTIAAQLATLPLLVGSFDRLSLAALPANLTIVPLMPFTMACGFAASILGIVPVVGTVAGVVTLGMSKIILTLSHWFAQLPFAEMSLPSWAWVAIVIMYAVMMVGWYYREKIRLAGHWVGVGIFGRKSIIRTDYIIHEQQVEIAEIPFEYGQTIEGMGESVGDARESASDRHASNMRGRWKKVWRWMGIHRMGASAAVFGIVCVVWLIVVPYRATQRFSVTVFDVGQGDAILVSAPGGTQMLVDGGPDARVLGKLGHAMPWWDRTIEYMVLTHPHADHVTGLVEAVRRYKVKKIFMTGVAHDTNEYHAFQREVEMRGIEVAKPTAGEEMSLGEALITVMHPFERIEGKTFQEPNDTSIVLKVAWGSVSFMLMGDAGVAIEPDLLERWGDELDAEVLKVGHQGSADASADEFLAAVTPRYAIISVGKNNTYGHPSPRVVRRLERMGAMVLRTDQNGDITLTSDGHGVKALNK